MAKRERVTKEEKEGLQRRIWVHRSRGMTLEQIAHAVGKSKSTVSHHLREARRLAFEYYEAAGENEIMGEMLLQYREIRQEALRNLARTQPGSQQRLVWTQEARQCVNAETKFLLDVGLIRRAPDKLDVSVTDVRSMSSDDIAREIARLREELAGVDVRGVTIPADGDDTRVLDAVDFASRPRALEHRPDEPDDEPDEEGDEDEEPDEGGDDTPDDAGGEQPPDVDADFDEFTPYGGHINPPEAESGP